MTPGETIRYACEECLVTFDLALLPVDQSPELQEEPDDGKIDALVMCCPFCMSTEIKAQHDGLWGRFRRRLEVVCAELSLESARPPPVCRFFPCDGRILHLPAIPVKPRRKVALFDIGSGIGQREQRGVGDAGVDEAGRHRVRAL
jgi:hypothetical protein